MDYQRTTFRPIDGYRTQRVSQMSELPAHRQIIYGRTFSSRWNPSDFTGITRYRSLHKFAWSDFGYSLVGIAFFAVLGYGIFIAIF